ncbi:hypothetical protein [Paenibacillus vini]|uniref:Uncharacterized protein n=1 Tax=Paenibacillus vini TaxID=1476024 RepID=A0ABQ4MJE7_9BACL|nr:hypothetical protein [Paenibacillus vini]GIP56118.1 hypothetical protein J42TS3_51530 [Paenibacillus vini]
MWRREDDGEQGGHKGYGRVKAEYVEVQVCMVEYEGDGGIGE